MLGLLVHAVVALGVGLVDLERGEALEVLEERVAQRSVLVPVAREDALGHLLDGHDDQRNERDADEKPHRGGKARRCHHAEERDRCEHRVEELRQVLAEVRLELLAALDGELHDLGGEDVLRVPGAKAQELLVYATTQRALHVLRRGEGLAGREPRGRQACDEGRGQGERGL